MHLLNWSVQILVLLSLGLQLVLPLLAGIRRRREANVVLRVLLWLAYLLANSTAIYALGHLSANSTAYEHQLVAFWGPFLILHLGGPDSISAYAFEDSQLWLRHLLMLVVQVMGAAYVVYKNIIASGSDSRAVSLSGTILMFVVGFVKFAERTWALKCGDLDSIRSSIKKKPHATYDLPLGAEVNEEYLARLAHCLFDICKCAVADSPVNINRDAADTEMFQNLTKEDKYAVIGMELSLMYDVLYTKAAVIHTWYGYFIRIVSPLATLVACLLFLCSAKKGHSRVDVAVTYALLVGAIFLETGSLVSMLGSTWFVCARRSTWLRGLVVWIIAKTIGNDSCRSSRRSWPGTIGQYSMLHMCAPRHTIFRPLLGRLAKLLGLKDWWETMNSGVCEITEDVSKSVFDHIHRRITRGELNTAAVIMGNWGAETLRIYGMENDLGFSLGTEFHEGIIIWHIGTDIVLSTTEHDQEKAAAIRAMSNYMMFLLVKHPYMLPGLAQNRLYQQTIDSLLTEGGKAKNTINLGGRFQELFRLHDDPASRLPHTEGFAHWLLENPLANTIEYSHLVWAIRLAKKLETRRNKLELVLNMWADFLVHAANRCSRESHAKKLNSGGEFTTIIWLLTEHFYQISVSPVHVNG